MTWRVRATEVRSHELGLRWTLEASTDDLTTTVTADTSAHGALLDLQSDGYSGTTGDPVLDDQVREHIADVLALRTVLLALDQIGQARGRSDRLRWAA
jgi:hypothetical protein